jgi:hypothetical protein
MRHTFSSLFTMSFSLNCTHIPFPFYPTVDSFDFLIFPTQCAFLDAEKEQIHLFNQLFPDLSCNLLKKTLNVSFVCRGTTEAEG